MKTLTFASRNTKEILRDKVNLFFGIVFPVLLLGLLTLIQSNLPVEQFPLRTLAPGIAVFGLSFISMFSGFLIAKDRTSSFMMRLMSSPMKSYNFIGGYVLPLIPMSFIQTTICYIAALCLGLPFSIRIIACIVASVPISLIFISIGLICGTLFTDKQVGSLCGAVLTNLVAWLSSTWFDVSLVGGWFENLANALPFLHAVNLGRNIYAGNWNMLGNDFVVILMYALILSVISIYVFTRKMKHMC
ncbi:ABC transporter permease [Amedibacillus sp. YH-ame6]